MARNIKHIAKALGAERVAQVPDVGDGAFGAARLSRVVNALKERLKPSAGRRPGRPTSADWSHHQKVPMSDETIEALRELAERMSSPDRRVSPMQVAAQLLEEAVASAKS